MANLTGNSKGRKWVSKDHISKMVKPEDLEEYLNSGWHLGHDTDHQQRDKKKWYTDGVKSYCIKEGDPVPEGLVRGMAQKRPGGYSKYGYTWYTNGIEQKRFSTLRGDIIPDGWRPGFSDTYKENMSKTLKAKGNYHLKNKPYSEEYKELYHDKEKLKEFIYNNRDSTLEELCERFNCTEGSLYSLLNLSGGLQQLFSWYGTTLYNGRSREEKEIVSYIRSIYSGEIIESDRKTISPQELDIYIPGKKLAIEYNGTYWHSSLNKEKNYHLNKSKLCDVKGIRLIHVYDYEWHTEQDKIKQLLNIALGNYNKIYARKCQVREISNKEAKPFNEATHLQNHRDAQVTYGLFYNGKLVQLMSFSKTKYNKNLKSDNSWEIIRGCPGSNNIVVGGVSKLIKYFIKNYSPDYIFSYCDFNKFNGKSYEAVGMKFIGYTGPDKTWIINGLPVKRNPRKYKELKELSEYIIWGSGSKKYLLEKDSMF